MLDLSKYKLWLRLPENLVAKVSTRGSGALLDIKTAPTAAPQLEGEMLERRQERLKQPQRFKSGLEIEQWLQQEFGKPLKYKTVHRTVRYRLKAKLKVPRPQRHKQEP